MPNGTFNTSQLPPTLPDKLGSLPPIPSRPPAGNPPLSSFIERKLAPAQNLSKKDIYQKYFGRSFGTGKATTLESYGGGLLSGGLHVGLKRAMRDFKRTSASGMNLSQKDIEHIGNKIGNVLKRLPTGKSYDSAKEVVPLKYQKKLIGELKKDVKKGVISSEDLRDAQQIIKNLEI